MLNDLIKWKSDAMKITQISLSLNQTLHMNPSFHSLRLRYWTIPSGSGSQSQSHRESESGSGTENEKERKRRRLPLPPFEGFL